MRSQGLKISPCRRNLLSGLTLVGLVARLRPNVGNGKQIAALALVNRYRAVPAVGRYGDRAREGGNLFGVRQSATRARSWRWLVGHRARFLGELIREDFQ